jgi:hypothetical protein
MTNALQDQHAAYFTERGVEPSFAAEHGVISLVAREDVKALGEGYETFANVPAFALPWTAPDGRRVWQFHPDNPTTDASGRLRKFMFMPGSDTVISGVLVVPGAKKALVCEGWVKALAAAQHVPAGTSVYAIAGARSWQKDKMPLADLAAFAGCEVTISFDADASGNWNVYQAGMDFKEALGTYGATKVRFLRLPVGKGTSIGLDDFLATVPENARAGVLERLVNAAKAKPADKAPARKKGPAKPAEMEPLDVTNAADAAVWLQNKIGTGTLAGYFNRDERISYCPAEGEEGYIPTSTYEVQDETGQVRRDEDGPAQVRTANAEQVAARISLDFWCFMDRGDDGKEHALFPPPAARTVANAVDKLPNLRPLRGVTHTPLVRRDGSILDTPGYDAKTGLYFLPTAGLKVPPVPEEPTKDEVAAAVALLDEVVWDFPFRSDDHRANFLGLLITPLIRELCPPPYKLVVFDAPMSRSGKTLLSKVARTLHGGVVRASIPTDEAEWSKTISTILNVTTAPIVTFDNVRGQITSGTLDGLISESKFNARQLGGTQDMIDRTNDRVWTITSNNAKLGGDLAKRALWVSINANTAHPENRSGWRHPDLLGWIAEHRGELLAALLTLVRAWIVAGRPAPSEPGTDIWAGWMGTVRAILEFAGVPGMFDRPDSKRQEVSDEDADWDAFLAAVHRVFGEQPWTCRQLLEVTKAATFEGVEVLHYDELPGDLGAKMAYGQNVAKALGRYLGFRAEAWTGAFRILEVGKDRNGVKSWRVEPQIEGEGCKDRPEGNDLAGFAGYAGSDHPNPESGKLSFEVDHGGSGGKDRGVGGSVDGDLTPHTPQTPQDRFVCPSGNQYHVSPYSFCAPCNSLTTKRSTS